MLELMKKYLLILLLFASAVLSAQTTTSAGFGLDPSDDQAVAQMKARMAKIREHRPTLALVLSGGGAKGAATVGALKYLEQYKFPVDMVVGTSIGGLIGGVYAMGYSPEFLDSLMRNINWERTMSDRVDGEYIPYGLRRYKERFALSFPFYYSVKDFQNQLQEDIRYANPTDGKLHLAAGDGDADGMVMKSLMSSLPSGYIFGQNVQAGPVRLRGDGRRLRPGESLAQRQPQYGHALHDVHPGLLLPGPHPRHGAGGRRHAQQLPGGPCPADGGRHRHRRGPLQFEVGL